MKLNTTDEFRLAVLSDIHLGSKRNKTEDIIYNLKRAFPDTQETAELDMVVFCGDIFDRLLEYPDEDVTHINIWIFEFLHLCSKNNIVVRILEGTPSHDRFQSEIFNTIKHISSLDVDLKYFKALDIEYIARFDKTFLYVPDEWEVTTDKTLEDVKSLMKAKNLTQVDFALMHGNFDYQLGAHIKKIPRHNSDEYLKLVKYYIFIGHIHIFSSKDRIIAQGSFDRLAHGEEGPKGHVRAVITHDDEKEFFFCENKLARIYKTFKCYKYTLEETLDYLRKKVSKLPSKSCVRVEADRDHPIFSNMNQLVAMYPTIVWLKLLKSNDVEDEIINTDEVEEYTQITINKDNIVSLLMSRITNLGVDPIIISKSEKLLTELI
jgi:DNA repair exonuclease SbcCD nuclease subunit